MSADLVMIRHGQSEANIIQKERKVDPYAQAPPGFFDRYDSRMRLSSRRRYRDAQLLELVEVYPALLSSDGRC